MSPLSQALQDSEHFQQYLPLIELDFSLGFFDGRRVSMQDHWEQMSELPSFKTKKGVPKGSRWFAWHEQADEQLKEWFAARCLLEWYFEGDGPGGQLSAPEDAAGFKESRGKGTGGLKLLYRALRYEYHEATSIILMVSRACWTWYTEQVSEVKTAQDGLAQVMAWATSWDRDAHLIAIVKTMYDWTSIHRMMRYQFLEGREDNTQLATDIFNYATSVLSRRLWSMSRYSTAPECYAPIFSDNNMCRQAAIDLMKNDWLLLCMAEQSTKCTNVIHDLQFLCSQPVRLFMCLFQQSGWDYDCEAARYICSSVLAVLPDNKIVEDAHQAVRVEAKSNPNQKMTLPHVQSCVMNSKIFSSRGLNHPSKLDKQEFVHKWNKRIIKQDQFSKTTFLPRFHKLPPAFSKIMSKKKTWTSVTEEQYGRSTAAWHWLRLYKSENLSARGILVDDTCLDSLIEIFEIYFSLVFVFLLFFGSVTTTMQPGWCILQYVPSWISLVANFYKYSLPLFGASILGDNGLAFG